MLKKFAYEQTNKHKNKATMAIYSRSIMCLALMYLAIDVQRCLGKACVLCHDGKRCESLPSRRNRQQLLDVELDSFSFRRWRRLCLSPLPTGEEDQARRKGTFPEMLPLYPQVLEPHQLQKEWTIQKLQPTIPTNNHLPAIPTMAVITNVLMLEVIMSICLI